MNINTHLSLTQTTQENTENLQQLSNTSSYPQTGQKRKADDNLQANAKRAKTLSDQDQTIALPQRTITLSTASCTTTSSTSTDSETPKPLTLLGLLYLLPHEINAHIFSYLHHNERIIISKSPYDPKLFNNRLSQSLELYTTQLSSEDRQKQLQKAHNRTVNHLFIDSTQCFLTLIQDIRTLLQARDNQTINTLIDPKAHISFQLAMSVALTSANKANWIRRYNTALLAEASSYLYNRLNSSRTLQRPFINNLSFVSIEDQCIATRILLRNEHTNTCISISCLRQALQYALLNSGYPEIIINRFKALCKEFTETTINSCIAQAYAFIGDYNTVIKYHTEQSPDYNIIHSFIEGGHLELAYRFCDQHNINRNTICFNRLIKYCAIYDMSDNMVESIKNHILANPEEIKQLFKYKPLVLKLEQEGFLNRILRQTNALDAFSELRVFYIQQFLKLNEQTLARKYSLGQPIPTQTDRPNPALGIMRTQNTEAVAYTPYGTRSYGSTM